MWAIGSKFNGPWAAYVLPNKATLAGAVPRYSPSPATLAGAVPRSSPPKIRLLASSAITSDNVVVPISGYLPVAGIFSAGASPAAGILPAGTAGRAARLSPASGCAVPSRRHYAVLFAAAGELSDASFAAGE